MKTSQEMARGAFAVNGQRLEWRPSAIFGVKPVANYNIAAIRTGTAGFCSLPRSIAEPFRRS